MPDEKSNADLGTTIDRGRAATSPWAMPWSAWKDVLRRSWSEGNDDNIGLVAAGVAFYGFLALVPLLGATVLSYGLLAEPATVIANIKSMTNVMPADAAKLVGEQLMNVVSTSGSKKGVGLLIALAVALFGARNGAGAIMTALNIAYEEKEKRGFVMVNVTALTITAGGVLAAILAVVAIAALGHLEALLPGTPTVVLVLGKLLSYGLLLLGGAAGAAALFRFGPSRERPRWVWLTPGSMLAALLWLVLTAGFGVYVAKFGNYNATYGSLGAVVVLLTWLYLSSYTLIFSAELNSELEHQTTEDTTSGDTQPLGARGAWVADHVADQEGEAEAAPGKRLLVPSKSLEAQGRSSKLREFAVARGLAFAGRRLGLQTPGSIVSATAIAGLALLRRPGRALVGSSLLASAGALAWLSRERRLVDGGSASGLIAVLFDIDGTLIDSNDLHVEAWERVFRKAGHPQPAGAIHDQIGKGGDNLVPALLPDLSSREQNRLAAAHSALFKREYLGRAKPFPGARDLLQAVQRRGAKVVLASSASKAEVDHYVDLIGATSLVDLIVTIDDVKTSKPAPDIFATAMEKLNNPSAASVVAVGDTPYDVSAAGKCGISTVGLLSGGFSAGDLHAAKAIYRDVADLLASVEGSPLA